MGLKKRKNRKNKTRKNKKGKKSKKNRKNKNKRKNRKNRKTKKNKRKNRKNRKNRNKNRKNNKGTRKSTRTIDGVCLESAVTAMRRWKDVVTNFEKQKKRIDKQSEIAGKKSGKQSVFGPIALKLVTDAFAEAQASLEDATGSTLSAAGLSSVAASVTTARARQRVRGFQSQRNMFQ